MTYEQYRVQIDNLVLQGKTTGENQSESYQEYTSLNVRRMCRLDRTIKMVPETVSALGQCSKNQYWLLLTEAWCGDAAQIVPVIAKIAELSDHVDLKILLRDDNPDVMDQFLTNGGRAIPKLISVDTGNLNVLWHWGPRPKAAQAIMDAYKANPVGSKHDTLKQIQLWYSRDKGISIQKELAGLLQTK
jgi:hypothetical protein